MSLTAYSLSLRSVNVTRAFEPSPPLRQDCEEIFSASTGDVPTGVMASRANALTSVGAGALRGATDDPSCAVCVAGACTGWVRAAAARPTVCLSATLPEEPGSSIHAATPTIRTAGTQINFDWKYLAGVFSSSPENLPPSPASLARPASPLWPVNSTRCRPVSIVMPPTSGETRCQCTIAEQMALHQTVPPLFLNRRNRKWFHWRGNNIGGQRPSRAKPRQGMVLPES